MLTLLTLCFDLYTLKYLQACAVYITVISIRRHYVSFSLYPEYRLNLGKRSKMNQLFSSHFWPLLLKYKIKLSDQVKFVQIPDTDCMMLVCNTTSWLASTGSLFQSNCLSLQQPQQQKPIVTSVGGQPVQPIRYGQESQPISLQPNQPQADMMTQPNASQAGIVKLPGAGAIPHLTAEQKKIVAEFKQKMAQLPPEQHTQFIAANKANLIKQLNFQPTQLQLLRSNQVNLFYPLTFV